MTSWKKRIKFLGKFIYYFFATQTMKPDIFYLWLAEEEFPNKEKDLPDDLLMICSAFNVQIKWTKDNEYCFKRWYVFPEHNDDMVISIDDDMFYDPRMIATVLEEYKRNPIPCVLHYSGCGGLIEITEGIKYTITQNRVKSSVRNYFIGQCAFTPHSFPLETLEPKIVELRKKICPKCDESFLHPYLIKDNIPIVFIVGLISKEDNEKQDVAIRNDLHFNLVNVNGKKYKKADIYKFIVLKMVPELQESWKKAFHEYNLDHFNLSPLELLEIINK